MGFNVTKADGSVQESSGVQVDWKALNEYIVEAAGLQQPETLVGVISGLYDLGIQPQEDAKMEFSGTASDEVAEVEKNAGCYFETDIDYQDGKKEKRYKRWPVKDQQSIGMSIDFPDILIDKSPFFGGDSDPKPLRLILGGEFTPAKGADTILSKPFPLSIRKNDKTNNKWSFPFNSTLYKMAVACKLVSVGSPFLPQDIDQLVGKAFQFKTQICFNHGGYVQEKCSFAAGLARGQSEPEFDEGLLHMIQFTVDNEVSDLKQLRKSVKNTMKRASNYEGSAIEAQLNTLNPPQSRSNSNEGDSEGSSEKSPPSRNKAPAAKKETPKKSVKEEDLDFDDDCPF